MIKMWTMFTLFCILYVNALPTELRVRRGFDTSGSGYGNDRGGGWYDRDSGERDASVSRDGGEPCDDSGESNDSREHTYGDRDYFGQRQDDKRQNGRRPR